MLWTASLHAHGLLIPADKSVPPLAMLNHKVTIAIDDQLAVTQVEQKFRNHTSRQLEATYIFPVPKGASVNGFSMSVDGKETKGELVEAKKARDIYTAIVRRTQDPGLLEYMGSNLLRLRVFPIPPKGDQKVSLRFTSVAGKEGKLIEYVYPLKTDGKAASTLEEFSITAVIKSAHLITSVYSPTHAIALKRKNDKEVTVRFDKKQGLLDKDFQLFYATGDKDVGLTALTHRPLSSANGYFTLLITPRVEIPKEYQVPRDVVLVLDTSDSMRGAKMEQARKALKYCLDNLGPKDRFGLINFASTVNRYEDKLLEANAEQVGQAKKWVEELDATGGTAINDALASALELRPKDDGRSFTVVFFTDGLPTIGETNPNTILKNTMARNTANTRIFTFGVGDDVNATMLDQLAEKTRALSTYVRPAEDIENKVSGLYGKISNPVLTNLKLTATNGVKFSEVYPAELPDLFHGGQLIVLGRFSSKGAAAIKLTGRVGKQTKEFVYEMTFPDKTNGDRAFVEHLWARRKVGFLLDQLRANGETKELVEEVITLAKKYGIATPYTSYLIVPDGAVPVARAQGATSAPMMEPRSNAISDSTGSFMSMGMMVGMSGGMMGMGGGMMGGMGGMSMMGGGKIGFGGFAGLSPRTVPVAPAIAPRKVADIAKEVNTAPDSAAQKRLGSSDRLEMYRKAREALRHRRQEEVQTGKLGVDLSLETKALRAQSRLGATALRQVWGRTCLEVDGMWIDEGFTAKTPTSIVKAQSDAYFKLLERQPRLKEFFTLGNHLVWIAPSGTALIIDTAEGKDKLSDDEIEKLFTAKK